MVAAVVKPDLQRLHWIARNLKIVDKHAQFHFLRPNNGQLLLHAEIQKQRARGLPVRIVLLKPRQVGWSTWSEAEGFHDVYHNANHNAMAVSVDSDSTEVIFTMTRRFQESMINGKPTDNTNRKAIIFSAPHRSAFYAQTAGKVSAGKGFQARFLHCSEVAFWQDAGTQLANLFQIVPNDAGTVVILESTANGIGGTFYDMYQQADQRRKSKAGSDEDYRGYRPVFFPWFQFPEYQVAPPDDFCRTDEEQEIAAIHNVTDAQLYWRRGKIEEVRGDVALFKQEYPATDIEAFQASGNNVFTAGQIESQKRHVTDCRTILFTGPDGDFEDVHRQVNCWHIARMPIAQRQYALGVDTMEGRLSDVKDPKSKLDFDGMAILDRMTGEVVAVYHGQGSQDDLAEQAYWAAMFYFEAFTGIEIPKGFTVLNYFKNKGYTNLYNRETHDETLAPLASENYGWRTTIVTRGWMVNDFITAMRDLSVTIYFAGIIEEMETFIKDKTGKCIHMPGKKDDLLFGLMIAIQIHKRCPLLLPSNQTHTTGEAEKPKQTIGNLAYSGAVDPGNEYDDDGHYYDGHTY